MEKFEQKVAMGSKVMDVLTGFKGIVVGYALHITGCDTVGIRPSNLDREGNIRKAEWVDVTRVKVLSGPSKAISLVVRGELQNGKKDETGGPNDIPMMDRG